MNKDNFHRIHFFLFTFLIFSLVLLPVSAISEEFKLSWPVKGKIVTDFHSTYINQTTGSECMHSGIDIAVEDGSPVKAAADGVVCFAGFTPAGGNDSSIKNTVSIEHPNGLKTTYLQLCEVGVSRGQNVVCGQTIAKVSTSGDLSSALPHLHLGLKQGDGYLDPKTYLAAIAEEPSGDENSDDQPENSPNPTPVDQSPQVLSIPEENPALEMPETLNSEQPGNQPEPVGANVSAPASNNEAGAVTSRHAVLLPPAPGLFSVLSVSRSQAGSTIKQEYLSSSGAEERNLSPSNSSAKVPRAGWTFEPPSSSLIAAAILAAISLALIQSIYPAFSQKMSDCIRVNSHFFSDFFMKGG